MTIAIACLGREFSLCSKAFGSCPMYHVMGTRRDIPTLTTAEWSIETAIGIEVRSRIKALTTLAFFVKSALLPPAKTFSIWPFGNEYASVAKTKKASYKLKRVTMYGVQISH